MVAGPLDALRAAADRGDAEAFYGAPPPRSTRRCSRPSAPAPRAAPASPNSTRGCSRSTRRLGWCARCVGTGVQLPCVPKLESRRALGRGHDQRGDRRSGRAPGRPARRGARVGRRRDARADRRGRRAVPARPATAARLNPHRAGRPAARPVDRRADRDCRSATALRWLEAGAVRRSRGRDRARRAGRDRLAARAFSSDVGLGYLSLGPRRTDALGRRGAAHPAGRAARVEPAGRVLRARRADDRPAPARQPHPARHARGAARQGQHAAGGRARRGHDPRAPIT